MKARLIVLGVGLLAVLGLLVFTYRRLAAHGDIGYVIIGLGNWRIESSLFFIGLTLVLAFLVFYFLIRMIIRASRLPAVLKQRSGEQRAKRSQQALISGLLETAEGNWEKAEKNLIRHAADSGLPLINYLTAARAAHSRGAIAQRDEYLKLARETTPEAELAIGLTRAELQLSNKQFDAALESLTHLHRINPSHAAVLRLLHQVYAQMEDWDALSRLLPTLHHNKVMMEAEITLLEAETYSALLKRRAESRNPDALRQLWAEVPEHVRQIGGIQTLYFAAMIEAGAGEEIAEALRLAIGKEWSETLLVLYGCVQMPDAEKQLQEAEAWLGPHPNDAVLYRVLAKFAWRLNITDKTREYLKRSLEIEASVEAYQLMGDLLFRQGDYAEACHFFRTGLMFASNEVVAQIDQNPAGEDEGDAG